MLPTRRGGLRSSGGPWSLPHGRGGFGAVLAGRMRQRGCTGLVGDAVTTNNTIQWRCRGRTWVSVIHAARDGRTLCGTLIPAEDRLAELWVGGDLDCPHCEKVIAKARRAPDRSLFMPGGFMP